MSTSAAARATTRSFERPGVRIPAPSLPPRLRVVPGRTAPGSPVGVVVTCLLLLTTGLVALLMVNISLGHGSYELDRLRNEAERLEEQRAAVSDSLAQRAAPQALEREARRYGMVPAERVTFISLKDGRVVRSGSKAGR